jgi:hypothetical protein
MSKIRNEKRITNSSIDNQGFYESFTRLLNKLLVPYSTVLFLACGVFYVGGTYLRRQVDRWFLYVGEDPGYVAPPTSDHPILGVHRFGDFLQILSYLHVKNPYSVHLDYPNLYGPIIQFLFQPFLWFPKLISVGILILLTFACLSLILWKYLDGAETSSKMLFTIFFLWFSRPFLLDLDRGNIQGFVVALEMSFVYLVLKKRNGWAEFLLIIAIAVKFYPVLFVFWFILDKNWRSTARVLIGSAVAIIVPFAIITSGKIVDGISGLLKGISIQSRSASSGSGASGWIIRNLELGGVISLKQDSVQLFQFGITLSIMLIGLFATWYLRNNLIRRAISIMITIALASPVSWGYTLIWLTFAMALLMPTKLNQSISGQGKYSATDFKYLLFFSFLIVPIPWNLQKGTGINVTFADLLLFPIMVITLISWVRQNARK